MYLGAAVCCVFGAMCNITVDRCTVTVVFLSSTAGVNNLLDLDPPCTNSQAMTTYLNSAAVKKALHIPDSLPEWAVCSDEVGHALFSLLLAEALRCYSPEMLLNSLVDSFLKND